MPVASLLRLMDPGKLSGPAIRRMKPEECLSREVAGACRVWTLEGRLDAVWSHVPNEIGGSAKNAKLLYAKTKHMGLISGAPDFFFVGRSGAVVIELKSKTGSLNPNQKDYRTWCETQRVPYHVCRTLAEVEAVLKAEGLLS